MTHVHEAERQILGALLLDPDSILRASDTVAPEDFQCDSHQTIFSTCLKAYESGEQFDALTIAERLRMNGELDKVGGLTYLIGLAREVPTAANVRVHAELVRHKALERRTLRWLQEKVVETERGVDDLQHFFGSLERGILDLSESMAEKHDPHISSIVDELRQDRKRLDEGEQICIPTDNKLATLLPGYYPGHLWVIGGYTSVGKSTFLAQLIVDICAEGGGVLVSSTEDSRKEKVMKLIANLSDVSQKRLMTGDLAGVEARVREAEETIKQWTLTIHDDVYTVGEIRLKAKKHKLQHGTDVVCIDFLQNLSGAGSLYERMSDAIIRLQAMAKELKVTVIALSQVSNEAMKQDSEVIGLKGAGELAAAADVVLWLKRLKGEAKERFLDCEVRKNRPFGQTGIVGLMFSKTWTRIIRR